MSELPRLIYKSTMGVQNWANARNSQTDAKKLPKKCKYKNMIQYFLINEGTGDNMEQFFKI